MRPSERGAGRPLGGDRGTAGANSKPIVAERDGAGKQADALTRLGEILAAMPKNEGAKGTGANQYGGAVPKENRTSPPTLADLGIDKKVSQPGAGKQAALRLWCIEFAVNLQRADVSLLALGFVGVAQ